MGVFDIERIRKICLALPEVAEKLSHGEPTFFVKKKVFVMYANNHHNDGYLAIWIPAPLGFQAMMIEASPDKFFKPPYVGVKGWVGVELNQVTDDELKSLILEAWKLIAPVKIHQLL